MSVLKKLLKTSIIATGFTTMVGCASGPATFSSTSDGYGTNNRYNSHTPPTTRTSNFPSDMYHEMETNFSIHKHIPRGAERLAWDCRQIEIAPAKYGIHPTQLLIGPLGSDNWKALLHKKYEEIYRRGHKTHSLQSNLAYQCSTPENRLKMIEVENAKTLCDRDIKISVETRKFGASAEWNFGNECLVRTYNTMRVHQQGFEPSNLKNAFARGEAATPYDDDKLREARVQCNAQGGKDAIVNYDKSTDNFSYQCVNQVPDLPLSRSGRLDTCQGRAGADFFNCASRSTGISAAELQQQANSCFSRGKDFTLGIKKGRQGLFSPAENKVIPVCY